MDLIIAVVLLVILLFRISTDKAGHKQAQAQYNEERLSFEQRKYAWLQMVTNEALEKELSQEFLSNDKCILNELNETKQFYGCSLEPVDKVTAMRILMANRHLLTARDAELGIKIEAHGASYAEMDKDYESKINFIWHINKKLIEAGIVERMYNCCFPLYYPFESEDYHPGTIVWEPIIPPAYLKASEDRLKELGCANRKERIFR